MLTADITPYGLTAHGSQKDEFANNRVRLKTDFEPITTQIPTNET